MDLRKLKTLIELVENSGIAELEVAEGEERVRITRSLPSVAGPGAPSAAHAMPPVTEVPLPGPSPAGEAAAEPGGHVVKSPMVVAF